MDKADEVAHRQSTHEQLCELRYQRIEEKLQQGSDRFDRLEQMLLRTNAKLWGIIVLIIASILVPQFIGV
ncbi:MAG: hypothetical protein VXW99_01130 [Pseudomonadota bacterium]|nr:hypothetical protein [Pseudomonadota bacterium]